MQTIADRIRQQMMEYDISQADIHRATGAGKATISSWLDGKTEPSSKYIASLAKTLKCGIEWLVTGQVNDICNHSNHSQVNQVQNSYVNGSVSQSVVNNNQCAVSELVNLDFYPQANINAPKQTFCLTKQTLPTPADFITICSDDLMHPVIRQRSFVAVRKLHESDLIYPNKIYVLNMGGLLICRYLERLTGSRMRVYHEVNKEGEIYSQDEFDREYQIMGSVVWVSSTLE